LNTLEARVLELIGESTSSPDVFTDTEEGLAPIRDSLNDAIQEIVMLTGSRIVKYYLPLRQEQMFYRFNPKTGDLGWVTDAWSINQRLRLEQTDLTKLSAHNPRWMVPNAEPRSYMQIGLDVIGFYPKPSSDSNTVELTVVEIPAPYATDSDRINLRDEFTYAAVNYAVSEYWASRGDALQAEVYLNHYLKALGVRELHADTRDRMPLLSTNKEPYPRETA
jgi:hypothetical protein